MPHGGTSFHDLKIFAHLASSPSRLLSGEASGKAKAHRRNPVSRTELVTRIAPPTLYLK